MADAGGPGVKTMDIIEVGLLIIGLLLIIAGTAQARFRYVAGRRRARRFYWTTSITGIVCFALGTGRIWPNGVMTALILASIVVGSAYMTTPYLKIGDRIYAWTPENRQPDPPVEER
jgi:hypothetical protein